MEKKVGSFYLEVLPLSVHKDSTLMYPTFFTTTPCLFSSSRGI